MRTVKASSKYIKVIKVVLVCLILAFIYAIFTTTSALKQKYSELLRLNGQQDYMDSVQLSQSDGDYKDFFLKSLKFMQQQSVYVNGANKPAQTSEAASEEIIKASKRNETAATTTMISTLNSTLSHSKVAKVIVTVATKLNNEDNKDSIEQLLHANHTSQEPKADFDTSSEPDINKWWFIDNSTEPDCSPNLLDEMKHWSKPKVDDSLLYPSDCKEFKNFWSYPQRPFTAEERDYPLAYVFMTHRNLHQTMRLFRAIYMPQNVYCINWDAKSKDVYKKTIEKMASCFDNVYVPKFHRNVYWCHNSVLKATMDCMEILHKSNRPWNYVQIVSWNDYPMKTNLELVQIYKRLNGTTDSDLEHPRLTRIVLDPNNKVNAVPPGDLVLYKGTYAATMPRAFVNFVFTNPVAIKFYGWLDNSRCGEELYWATLVHNRFLRAPGHFPGPCIDVFDHIKDPKPWISRYQLWEPIPEDYRQCKGKMVLYSCVYGTENVEPIKTFKNLMAHKFYEEIQPAALYCMEKWHYSKTYNRTRLDDEFLDYYSNMPSVRYHNLPEEEKDDFTCIEKLPKNFRNFGKL